MALPSGYVFLGATIYGSQHDKLRELALVNHTSVSKCLRRLLVKALADPDVVRNSKK